MCAVRLDACAHCNLVAALTYGQVLPRSHLGRRQAAVLSCRAWRQRYGARCRGGALPGSRMPRRLRHLQHLVPSKSRSSLKIPRQQQRRTMAVPSRRRLRVPASPHQQHHQQQQNRRRRLLRLQSLPQTRRLQDRQRSKPQMQRQMLHRVGSRRATHPGDSQPTVPLRRRRHSRRRLGEIEDSSRSLMLKPAAADCSSGAIIDLK